MIAIIMKVAELRYHDKTYANSYVTRYGRVIKKTSEIWRYLMKRKYYT